MNYKPLVFAGLCLSCALPALRYAYRGADARAKRETAEARLREAIRSKPRPALAVAAGQKPLRPAPAAAAAVPPAAARSEPLSEELLAPLRRAFTGPRIVERGDLPAARQTLLANRLVVSPEVRALPHAASGGQSATRRGTTPFLVLFDAPVGDRERQLLAEAGATVRGYIPNNALLAELTPAALARLARETSVRGAEEFLPTDKLQPFLAWLASEQPAEARVTTALQTFAPEDAAVVAEAVRAANGDVLDVTPGPRWGLLHAVLPLGALPGLAARGEVQWIEERARLATCNDKASIGTHLNATNVWQTWGLTGSGQIVGHADTGLDTGVEATLHTDFRGQLQAIIARARPGNASDPFGHGTHTAGSIVGSGAGSGGLYRGTAHGARLVHQSVVDASGAFTGITDVYSLFEESYGYGARIHSDSWGSETAGAYDSDCRSADLFAWEHPDHLACFAAGNSGRDNNSDGVVDNSSMLSPASAKNVLAVGAAENDRPAGSGGYSSSTWGGKWSSRYLVAPIRSDLISYSASTSPYLQGLAAFSSRGPTQDGRIKPDIVAPGTDVISTRTSLGGSSWGVLSTNTLYCFNGGTSMATPLAAGTAALARQYAVERGGITNPSSALLKAMLVGGSRTLTPGQYGTGTTREIPAVSPNPAEGWGEPDLEAALHPAGRMVRLFDRIAVAPGATNTYTVTVSASNAPLDVALCWVDYPATAGAAVTRVNDLDLLVTAPDGALFYPNSGAGRDATNTVETVRIAAAKAGVYQLRVIGAAVPFSGGPAALYVRGALNEAPLLLHTPLTHQTLVSPSYRAALLVQSLAPLTNGETRLFWAAGTASGATGAWHQQSAAWSGGARYQSDIPAQPAGTRIHYYLQAASGAFDVRLPAAAPASTYSFYVGTPLELVVEGSPARFGAVVPPYGTNTVVSDVPAALTAPLAVALSNGVRRVCAGWSGSGDAPASGTTNALVFTPARASGVTWQWRSELALTNRYRNASSGAVIAERTTWLTEGASASTETAPGLQLVSGAPYGFSGWSVDNVRWTNAAGLSPNPASGILMNRPHVARADYLPFWQDSDANGLGDAWEQRYYGTTSGGRTSGADPDGDGWSNLSESLDGTDPRDPASLPAPPAISFTPLAAFQTAHSPWTVRAAITDNLYVQQAYLIWRERDEAGWRTNALSWASNAVYEAQLAPPSLGVKRVDYFLAASDLLGYYGGGAVAVTPVYSVAADYDAPWLAAAPSEFATFELSGAATVAVVSVSNLVGPDLLWTARVAAAAAPFVASDPRWSHSGANDLWHADTNRTWNGDAVWYCGDASTRSYPSSCDARLDTPPFRVGAGGGLLFRHWIATERKDDTFYWDGAVVRVSSDGGTNFAEVAPVRGYPCRIVPNGASPFDANAPCFAGKGEGWRTDMLDLSAYAGQTVVVRFEFGSDDYVSAEGWYVGGVTPFSLEEPAPAWLIPQGAWQGVLAETWSSSAAFRIEPTALARNEEAVACVRLTGNDPDHAPLVPVTVRRGSFLTAAAQGPGAAALDRAFLFRSEAGTVSLQADEGAYLYGVTVNAVPQAGVYNFGTTSRSFVFSNPGEDLQVAAWFGYRTWTLTVTSADGAPVPAVGSHTLTHGAAVEASVATPLLLGNDARKESLGWSLAGLAATSGTLDRVSFVMTNDAALAWSWQTEYRLTATAGAHGTVNPTSAWCASGSNVVVSSYPETYYHLQAWSGDTAGATPISGSLTLLMDGPRAVAASFAPNLTMQRGVPEYWLAEHGAAGDFEVAAENDADADGAPAWAEWLADTDPSDARSVLRLAAPVREGSSSRITWTGGAVRTQLLQSAASPAGPWLTVHTNLPPTPTTNTLTRPASASRAFYRVFVP